MQNDSATETRSTRDFRAEVTADIIRLLEGGTAPWQMPWHEASGLPLNPTTGRPYRGGNVIALMISGMRRGYTDPRWMTYRQAAAKGWQVRKGEKASLVEFWDVKRTDKEQEEEKPGRLIHRVYAVFNAQQIDGIPTIVSPIREAWEVCATGERILKSSGAEIRYGSKGAFYSVAHDRINLPLRENFISAPAFYGTATHELIHWTGASKRLNRATLTRARGFDQRDGFYAREELVAEIGSMMLAAESGIPHDPAQHAAYVESWIKALKNDKNEIFRAAGAASAAVDYVLQSDKAQQVA